MPNDAMMEQMMSQMQGEAPPMPPPEMMMEQAEGVTMPEGGIGSMNDALQQALLVETVTCIWFTLQRVIPLYRWMF